MQTPTPCTPAALAIEALLRERRALSSELLNLDAYERWGGGGDSEMNARLASGEANRRYADCEQRSKSALAGADLFTRASLADAHIFLLQIFIEECEKKDAKAHSTAIFVAKGEIRLWSEYKAGERDDVEQNIFYVHYDAARYAALLGEK